MPTIKSKLKFNQAITIYILTSRYTILLILKLFINIPIVNPTTMDFLFRHEEISEMIVEDRPEECPKIRNTKNLNITNTGTKETKHNFTNDLFLISIDTILVKNYDSFLWNYSTPELLSE